MRLQIVLFLLCMNVLTMTAQSIKVAIFNDKEINSLTINIKQGRYLLKRGDEVMGEYKRGSIFHITRFGNTIEVRDKRNFIGNFQTLEFSCTTDNSIFDINPVNPVAEGKEYDDNLTIS